MLLSYLVLIVALSLSAVAAFYSIYGLAVIFAAASIPIIIMGSILEVAKLVVTVWLHEYWRQTRWVMKMYLVPAVVILMLITSMGIFGFLSRAHIEQTSQGAESQAQVERINKELERQQAIIERAETRVKQLETGGTGVDGNVNNQIAEEQKRIEAVMARIQPAIDEQQRIIDAQTKIYQDQIAKIDEQSKQLQEFINNKEVDKAQALVGTRSDGNWGPGTARAVQAWQAARAAERAEAVAKLEQANNNPTIRAAREEILRIRNNADKQIAESNRLIDRLREQLGKTKPEELEQALSEQQARIKTANDEIDQLTEKKFQLEAEYRKLEAEVGPIKYIAALIYGDENTDVNTLEKAVRWLIIVIVAVFDPLAVMMLLAYTESRSWYLASRPKLEPVLATTPVVVPPPPEPEPVQEPTAEPAPENVPDEPAPVDLHQEIDDDAHEHDEHDEQIKEAKRQWKLDNPDKTIKEQRRLLANGQIDRLPWEDYKTETVVPTEIAFGQIWPDNPVKGYMFLRTDYVPTKLFKFNGSKWIEVDKEMTDGYVTNDDYINFLMKKVESGEYDPELLSEAELSEIERKLQKKGN